MRFKIVLSLMDNWKNDCCQTGKIVDVSQLLTQSQVFIGKVCYQVELFKDISYKFYCSFHNGTKLTGSIRNVNGIVLMDLCEGHQLVNSYIIKIRNLYQGGFFTTISVRFLIKTCWYSQLIVILVRKPRWLLNVY